MKPFEIVNTLGPFGDECSFHEMRMLKQMSVQELIDYVLTEKKGEWGYIEVNRHRLEYRSGGIVFDTMTDEDKGTKINSLFCHGGWSRFDYIVNSTKDPFKNK